MESIIFGILAFVITILIIQIANLTNEKNKMNDRLENLEMNRSITDNVIRDLQQADRLKNRDIALDVLSDKIYNLKMTKQEVKDYLDKHIVGGKNE